MDQRWEEGGEAQGRTGPSQAGPPGETRLPGQEPQRDLPARLPEPAPGWASRGSGGGGGYPQTCSRLPSPAPQRTTPFPLPLVQPQDWIWAFTATPAGPPSYIRPLEVPQLLPLGHFPIKCTSVWPISPFCEMHADTAMPSSARAPPHPGLSGSPMQAQNPDQHHRRS